MQNFDIKMSDFDIKIPDFHIKSIKILDFPIQNQWFWHQHAGFGRQHLRFWYQNLRFWYPFWNLKLPNKNSKTRIFTHLSRTFLAKKCAAGISLPEWQRTPVGISNAPMAQKYPKYFKILQKSMKIRWRIRVCKLQISQLLGGVRTFLCFIFKRQIFQHFHLSVIIIAKNQFLMR